jgi:hypothetical protein
MRARRDCHIRMFVGRDGRRLSNAAVDSAPSARDALRESIGRGSSLQRDRRLARDRVQHSSLLVGTDVVAAVRLEPLIAAATGGAAGARDMAA